MVFVRLASKGGWSFPVDENGKKDWLCPKCGHEHTSCCGNSHFPCTKSAQYSGKCKCEYLDSLGSFDFYVHGTGKQYYVREKVTVKLSELLDIFFAGLDGDWQDYMFVFLRDDVKVTEQEIRDYAKKLGETKGYGKEDEEAVLDKASWFWKDRGFNIW